MTSKEFRERLTRRARHAGVSVNEATAEQLETYFRLLARWNEKINLTALPLRSATHETFDRLFVEPLAAARHVENRSLRWYDFGSGGGSPAIPLKIVRPQLILTMVESKARKAAFLREAVRVLGLENARVDNTRFGALVPEAGNGDRRSAVADLLTVRAVRVDEELTRLAARLLAPGGRLLLFRPTDRPVAATDAFQLVETTLLTPDEPRAYVTVLGRCSTWNTGETRL